MKAEILRWRGSTPSHYPKGDAAPNACTVCRGRYVTHLVIEVHHAKGKNSVRVGNISNISGNVIVAGGNTWLWQHWKSTGWLMSGCKEDCREGERRKRRF